ncbi:MAG: tetratricopeptide repeat protein [Jaaginema sp. PMC 1079.18]|nr:tetratricopeptide repeat protein [Jaaginema sp. PMC 1080.18]MEC4851387.1 tetratricopeptide repeat protein [Jaaginema sp. PMC 1079.18]MEC4864487.1 tetratricopeptide repeat protein [Jaaginema sp. PMC 1078.18]
MTDEQLPLIYLSILLVLLAIAGFLVFSQVFKVRKTEGKISKLQNKLKKEKGTALDYYELASLYLDKKLYTQAAKLFQKALKSGNIEAENKALIHNGLGYSYFANEQYDVAIRQYKEALDYNPEYIIALNNLAFAYERKKLLPAAIETYERTLKCDPNNATAKRRVEALRKRFVSSS